MLARATTRISILRGGGVDQYGDDEPTNVVVARGVRASVIEKSRSVFDMDSSTPRIVHYTTARVSASVDIKTGDRVKDERTGYIYNVESFTATPARLGVQFDKRVDLRRIS